MDVSENNGTPKSSILIGFSIINHPFWGTPILETLIYGSGTLMLILLDPLNHRQLQVALAPRCLVEKNSPHAWHLQKFPYKVLL